MRFVTPALHVVENLKIAAGAFNDTGQRVLGALHRQFRFLADEVEQTA